jgi:hypothetical protein
MRLLWDFQCLLGSFQFTRPRGRCFHLLVGTILLAVLRGFVVHSFISSRGLSFVLVDRSRCH